VLRLHRERSPAPDNRKPRAAAVVVERSIDRAGAALPYALSENIGVDPDSA